MTEGADSLARICENSLTTLKLEDNLEELPPRTISYNTRRPRFGTGNVPLSPYILIDGKKLRSSLAFTKKSSPRRVSFPANDNLLVTGYLEPANPWKLAENVNQEDLISAYKASCKKHNTDPLEIIISQLKTLDVSKRNSELLNLKGQTLDPDRCEPLEEIFKRVQFNKVDLEATSLDDESSVILFDMLEYYDSTRHLNISSNPNILIQGWHACANFIRKSQCLKHFEAKDVTLKEQHMNILSRALRVVCHLHVLNLENCGLSGGSIITLVSALKMNTGIRELYLADNRLNFYDAIQLGSLLRFNNHIQLLDISNNNIQDDGVRDILEGLINQLNEDKDGKGLNVLILWNNQLTQKSSPYFSRIIALYKTLETLNIGKNTLTDELLFAIKDALKKNRILLQLGIQSTELTCNGIVTLSEIIEINQVLQRIDLRNNDIQMTGLRALNSAMKKNRSIIKVDLDDKPKTIVEDLAETLHQYSQLVAEIEVRCSENEQSRTTEENIEGFDSSRHSILCSTNSRKISLTCQTLPCSIPTMITIQSNASGGSMLEPKRINGGRLRSPALSPASSPIVSPIPSPSRSRFVVSRVPETSLCSTNSSPITISLESPTCLASSASGSSRFRVSVVESANTIPSLKPVVPTSNDDISFDLNFQIDSAQSKLETDNHQDTENFQKTSSKISYLIPNEMEKRHISTKLGVKQSVQSVACKNEEFLDVQSSENNCTNYNKGEEVSTCIMLDESVTDEKHDVQNSENNCTNYRKDEKLSSCIILSDEPVLTDENCTQKEAPNLEKLLALFQHPKCFFPIGHSESTFQDGTNFHCYLNENRRASIQENSKLKFFNVSRILNFKGFSSIFPLYSNFLLRKELKNNVIGTERIDNNNDNKHLDVRLKKEVNVISLGDRLVPEEVRSKFLLPENYVISNVAIVSLKMLNNGLLTGVSENNIIVPLSVLKASIEDVKEALEKVDPMLAKETCDKRLTDSINFASDSNSLFCNIMRGVTNVNDARVVNRIENVHNLVILKLNAKHYIESGSVLNVKNKQTDFSLCDCNVYNKSATWEMNVGRNCSNNKVTKTHSIYNNNNNNRRKDFTNVRSDKVGKSWQSTIVNSRSGSSKKSFMYEDINIDSDDPCTDLYTSVIYKDVTNPLRIQEVLKMLAAKNEKYFESRDPKETKISYLLMVNLFSRFKKIDIVSIPRAYCCVTYFDKSIPRDLIFYVDDYVNRISDEEDNASEIISSSCPNKAIKLETSINDLSRVSNSDMNFVIQRLENLQRGNEVSRIEGKSISTSRSSQESMGFHKIQKYKENNDSETDEKYSIGNWKKSVNSSKKNDTRSNAMDNIFMFRKFGSNIVQRVKLTNSDAISDMTHKYLNTIKCAVATSMCSKVAANARNNATVDIISDESANVAEPSTVIHATSTK
ncbi:uncharacterized protein LOC143351997 isoform X2 [Colletes latitarsis]|uniref:uncharacterized protein LOC143351997 isoform X2 n=1 Tax=Colletes latitarsis TaxID=2605962 RepID=UPI004037415F